MDKLITLPGVVGKKANDLISEWFAKPLTKRGNNLEVKQSYQEHSKEAFVSPENSKYKGRRRVQSQGFVVDTHVARVSIQ